MNQEQVKQKLLDLEPTSNDFSVVFSGKASKKVDGLYKPETREIILHTKNFSSDNELLYTAIHEYAHHIQFTESPVPVSNRSHTTRFWGLFHSLLVKAEGRGLYSSPFDSHPDFVNLTRTIREEFLKVSGDLMKELGRLLIEARDLCEKHHASFGDYLDRVLTLPRNSARTIIRSHTLDLKPEVGFENMRILARIKEEGRRVEAQEALLRGTSQDMIKMQFLRPDPTPPLETLKAERHRIQRQIESLAVRLQELDRRIEGLEGSAGLSLIKT